MNWRLLDTGHKTAAENMALDDVLLAARAGGLAPDTIRFLQFDPSCVLVGFHQAVEQEIRVEYCRSHGIEINRRVTGGGALYWDTNQIGWEVIAAKDHLGPSGGVERIYARFCTAVARALQRLGVNAAYRPRNDIEVNGRKISGTGGTDLGGAFLFQGSLLVDFNADVMLRALRVPTEKLKQKEINSLKQRVTCLRRELGRVPPVSTIKQLIAAELARELKASLLPGGLTTDERRLLAERLPFFQSEQWINTVDSAARRAELRASRRFRGGLIRASLILGGNKSYIEQIYLTGDFFSHPQRVIYDLESSLRGLPAEPAAVIAHVSNYFASCKARLPGIKPEDVAATIIDALEKSEYPKYGIPPEAVNDLFTVGKPLPEIGGTRYALLPYCAKLPACRFRFRQGCGRCGDCDTGKAWDLARKYDFKVVTVQNFEHLAATLKRLKKLGASSFLGSCCEAFLIKHRRDFERIGLPGILLDVDSTTCYELKLENDAHAGHFENCTRLKLDLLETVMARAGMGGAGTGHA